MGFCDTNENPIIFKVKNCQLTAMMFMLFKLFDPETSKISAKPK